MKLGKERYANDSSETYPETLQRGLSEKRCFRSFFSIRIVILEK
jgi:hypothetical protein